MNDAIDRMLERIRQNTDRRMADLARQRAQLTPGVTRAATSPAPGARVFDVHSGQEGTVVHVGSENVSLPASE